MPRFLDAVLLYTNYIAFFYFLHQGGLGQYCDAYNSNFYYDTRGDFLMDELRVWDVARTRGEIIRNMKLRFSAGYPGLLLAFDWDDTDGNDLFVNDYSGLRLETLY